VRYLIDSVRNSFSLRSPHALEHMIILLAILAWTFLVLLVVCLGVSAQQGDLSQSPRPPSKSGSPQSVLLGSNLPTYQWERSTAQRQRLTRREAAQPLARR
jgi:hypothetical protein